MDRVKTILVSILLLLVTGAVSGVPEAIHRCCDEPVEVVCAPEDCCGEDDEDSCCDTEITLQVIDDEAALAVVTIPSPIQNVIALVPVVTAAVHGSAAPQRMIACSEAHPPPPPDRSVLSVYLI